jgi:hypothetical protein
MVARQERATGVGVSVECTDAEGDWSRYGGIISQAVSLARKRAKSPEFAERLSRLAGALQGNGLPG